jgi:hypothetical protein
MDSRVAASNGTQVALEMTEVDGVKANLLVNSAAHIGNSTKSLTRRPYDGDPKPDISFRQDISDEIVFSSQNFLKSIEGLEKRHNSCLVGLLFDSNTCLIDTVYRTCKYNSACNGTPDSLLTVS